MKRAIPLLTIVLALSMLISACSAPTAEPATPETPPPPTLAPPLTVAALEITATSPHVADGVDGSQVEVVATNEGGAPVLGADIVVVRLMGLDIKEAFDTTDQGDGTYTAAVTSMFADTAVLVAVDLATGVEANTEVVFVPGEAEVLEVESINPRDYEPREKGYVLARLLDSQGNIIDPGQPFDIETTLGEAEWIDALEGPTFVYAVWSWEVGVAEVTVADLPSGLQEVVELTFPAKCAALPREPVYVDATFEVPINIFVNPDRPPLGFYDLVVDFDPGVIQLVDVLDGDVEDGFPTPEVESIDDGTVRIWQEGQPYGPSVDVARLVFVGVEEGMTGISLELWEGSEYSLVDIYGDPVPHQPNVGIPPGALIDPARFVNVKKPYNVCLNILVEYGCAVTGEEIREDMKDAQRVFDAAFLGCCAINILPVNDADVKTFWPKDYDLNGDNKLDDYTTVGTLTREEKELLKNTKAKRSDKCVNVYYFCQDLKNSLGSAMTPKDFSRANGSVMLGKGARDYASNKGLVHEIAHLLGELLDKPGNGTPNLMETGAGTNLDATQCKAIMENGVTGEYLTRAK